MAHYCAHRFRGQLRVCSLPDQHIGQHRSVEAVATRRKKLALYQREYHEGSKHERNAWQRKHRAYLEALKASHEFTEAVREQAMLLEQWK